MTKRGMRYAAAWAVVFGLFGALVPASAQYAPPGRAPQAGSMVRIRDIDWRSSRSRVQTPNFRSTAEEGVPERREWWRMLVAYDVELPEGQEWLDGLTFEYYVLAQTVREGRKLYSFYKTQVTYIDIEAGRDRRSTVFLQPRTVARYGEPVAVAVRILHGGELQAEASDAQMTLPRAWWRDERVVKAEGVALRPDLLKNRSQTPFALVDIDGYEVIQ